MLTGQASLAFMAFSNIDSSVDLIVKKPFLSFE